MKRKKQPTKTKAPAPVATNDRIDKRKRLFFKLLGVAGLGFFGSLLAPKKAEAYVFGSTPSTSVVGVKNSSNARVNPATEDGNLATIVTNTNKIPSQGQAVMASSTPVVIASNQTTLPISGTVTASFDTSSAMVTDSADSLFFLRRIAELLEGVGTVDAQRRLRVTLDSITTSLTLSTITTVGTVTTVTTCSTVTSVTNMVSLAGWTHQMFQDPADNAYANSIRRGLDFTSSI